MVNLSYLAGVCDDLLGQSVGDDFGGHDPFDALNSRVFQKLSLGKLPLARIFWLQAHKRSPLNFRGIIGVPKGRNPKGVALMILGLICRSRYTKSDADVSTALGLAKWLLTQSADRRNWKHYAWGYHFDWAARAFYVPRGTPNAITTCYVARALRELGDLTGESRLTEVADDAGYFLDGLYTENDGRRYYAYIPGETAFVHNASLWTAAVVSQTAASRRDESLRERALDVARQSVSLQAKDGSWPYGSLPHHTFIDGFHTGYNLEALNEIQLNAQVVEFSESISRGLIFYRDNFFSEDGSVKYYSNRIWPLDMHSVAQAILVLLKIGGSTEDKSLAESVVKRALTSLYLSDKRRFIYQRGRFLRNKIDYSRWTRAWAFYALSYYIAEMEDAGAA